MVQKSQTTTWDVFQSLLNNGIKLPSPQLVSLPDFDTINVRFTPCLIFLAVYWWPKKPRWCWSWGLETKQQPIYWAHGPSGDISSNSKTKWFVGLSNHGRKQLKRSLLEANIGTWKIDVLFFFPDDPVGHGLFGRCELLELLVSASFWPTNPRQDTAGVYWMNPTTEKSRKIAERQGVVKGCWLVGWLVGWLVMFRLRWCYWSRFGVFFGQIQIEFLLDQDGWAWRPQVPRLRYI